MTPTTSLCPAAWLALTVLAAATPAGLAADRDVQFRSIDLDSNIVELHNFGANAIPLAGWRFCTHDFDQFRQYSGINGLNAFTLGAGESLFVHFNNDAPAAPDAVNVSSLAGFFAAPLNPAAYALQIFSPGADSVLNFNSTADMVDHVQWATDPSMVGLSTNRSVQAANAGLWTGAADWVLTQVDTGFILLTDQSGGELHGPGNYVLDPVVCPPDLNADGVVDNGDIGAFITLFLLG